MKVHRLSFGLKDTVSTPDHGQLLRDLTDVEPKGKGKVGAKGKPKGKDQGKSKGTDRDKGKGKSEGKKGKPRPALRGL